MAGLDFLIAGLGNPGEQYLHSRHNLGFLVVDDLARRWQAGEFQEKWQGRHILCRLGRMRVHLVEPLTFMNRSGLAVAQYQRFYQIPLESLLVIHDDLDLPPGRVKLARGGGTAGHNGLRSIVATLGSSDFYRLKIGIGRPGQGDVHHDFPVDRYVLSALGADEQAILQKLFDRLEEGIRLYLQGEPAKAMGLLNTWKSP